MSLHSVKIRRGCLFLFAAVNFLFSGSQILKACVPVGDDDGTLVSLKIPRYGDLPVINIGVGPKALRALLALEMKFSCVDIKHRDLVGALKKAADADFHGRQMFESPAIRIGDVSRTPTKIGLLNLSEIERRSGQQIDAIIGFDILREFCLRFDFDNGIFAILKDAPRDSGEPFRLKYNANGAPTLELAFGENCRFDFQISTASDANISIDDGQRTRLETRQLFLSEYGANSVFERDDSILLEHGKLYSVRLGPYVHDVIPARVQSGAPPHLGLKYLSKYIITIDFPNDRVFFRPGRNFAKLEVKNQIGLTIVRNKSRFLVGDIRKPSPASWGGLLPYDVIERVNDEDVNHCTLFELRNFLDGATGPLRIEIERSGQSRQFIIHFGDANESTAAASSSPKKHNGSAVDDDNVICEAFFKSKCGAVVLSVTLASADRPLRVLVDTGASNSIWDPRVRHLLGEELGNLSVRGPLFNNRQHPAVRIPAIQIGDFQLATEEIGAISELSAIRRDIGHDIDGIIGMNSLFRHIVQIDFNAGSVRFLRKCDEASADAISMEFTIRGLPVVPVVVGNETRKFMIDTGWNGSNCGLTHELYESIANKNALKFEIDFDRDRGETALEQFATKELLKSLKLGGVEHKGLDFEVLGISAIGRPLLRKYKLTCDFPNSKAYFASRTKF